MGYLTTTAPDDPDGTTYELAPSHIVTGIQRRFESRPVVKHPTETDTWIYDPGNFWDGPTHVEYDPASGTFSVSGWNGDETFPLIGPLR